VIGIVNVGPVDGETNPIGEHRYEVRINREVITTFTHHRANGLAECLRQAARAVDHHRDLQLDQLLQEMQHHKDEPQRNIRRSKRQT
jgi:hypothetical protein